MTSFTEKRYVYTDPSGVKPTLRVVRRDFTDGTKKFYQEHMEDGEWRSGGSPTPVAPYKYDTWSDAKREVYLTEGEKCAERLLSGGKAKIRMGPRTGGAVENARRFK